MAKICINIPEELKDAIKVQGDKDERSITWVVKKAIEEYLENHKE